MVKKQVPFLIFLKYYFHYHKCITEISNFLEILLTLQFATSVTSPPHKVPVLDHWSHQYLTRSTHMRKIMLQRKIKIR